ncbi:MAG: DUF4197 domain-containing protein [Alcanivoracaceae bacterium]|nr:DUF4197 domain-containing protein [Alcanivoracaceae bacterium]
MKTRLILLSALVLGSAGCANGNYSEWFNVGSQVASDMGYGEQADVAGGIKQALELGSERAAATLSADGGYSRAGYPISLPQQLQPVADTLRKVGMGSYVDKVEAAMNDGAEKAAAESVPVVKQAISEMTVTDALGIVNGGQTAATDYFRGKTETSLRQRYQPIIRENLQKTGFYDQYQAMLGVYNALPLTSKPNLDVEEVVTEQALDGLYGRIAAEEKLIRQDPVGRGSALLGRIFSGQ